MVTDESIQEALDWASELDATMGGTEMSSVIKHACEEQDDEYKKQVILFTNASVGGYDCITCTISDNYENSKRDIKKPVVG